MDTANTDTFVKLGLVLFALVYFVFFLLDKRNKHKTTFNNLVDKFVQFAQNLVARGLPIAAGVALAVQGKATGDNVFAQFSFLVGVYLNFYMAMVWAIQGYYLIEARKEIAEKEGMEKLCDAIDYYGKVTLAIMVCQLILMAIVGGGQTGVGIFVAGTIVGSLLPRTDTMALRDKALELMRKTATEIRESTAKKSAEQAQKAAEKERAAS